MSTTYEESAARLADDSVGVQFLSITDIIDGVGAVTLLTQDLAAIAVRQVEHAGRDYAALLTSGGETNDVLLRWAGSRIAHQSEGMLELVRTISAETGRLGDAHDAMWASFREVM